ncbi:DotA/TraY family protein [Escherichia coli]|uniref:DotA/TraY family protein n=5 Tax=Escherichia coli TaxID=562 RepID=A0A7L7EKF7_ECOLX|nr:DotA/TraY family protein [Escherichia coli]KXM32053.1 conjugal transfer protein [Escherichia coli]KXN22725.1 conjugal transfer protein [Escherichia coli]MBA8292168.1 DotA/TraY family protein [Escherichia coli]MBA8378080.1 DotA/TraY family protein [Escherichia coli]MBA8387394.1 DotA/TraY family protein [Escherichia coli]
MTYLRKLFAGIMISMMWIPLAFADSSVNFDTIEAAAKRSSDLSRQLLVMIFGDVVTDPFSTNTTMIGELFYIFNGVAFVLAVIWFLIIGLKHIARAGHLGKVFSGGDTSASVVTTVAGFITLAPTVSGWSLAQLMFLWAVSVMGIGSANLMTDKIADLLASGFSLTHQPVAPQTVSAARSIYEMNLCMYGVNNELSSMYSRYGQGGTPLMTIRKLSDGFEISNGNARCGSVRLPAASGSKNSFWGLFGASVDTSNITSAQQNGLNQMQNDLNQAASRFVTALINRQQTGSGELPDAETDIQNAARAFEDRVNQAVQAQDNGNKLTSAMTEQLKKYGWLSLGSWYQTFATANQKVNDAAALKPVVSGISGIGEIGAGDTLSGVMTAYQAQLQNTSYTPPLGTPNIKNTQMADSDVPSAMLTNIFESPGQYLANYFATSFSGNDINEQTNPLLKMKDIGDRTLVTTETALISFTLMRSAVETYTKGVSGFFLEILSFKGSELAKNIIVTISPIVFFVLIILLGIGFSLSIYLPFIPFIYWLSGSANWVVSVLVGSTGGSLWAATHIGTEKDKGSRAAYGYIFLIDGMIRPMLMVLGFAFSSLTLIAIGTLLNILYASAIANVQSNSITGLVSLIGILMIYARLCTTTVSRVFALQVTMPDYIISWLGGREAASILGNAVDSTKEIFAGFSHGLQRTPGVKLGNANNSSKGNMDGIK